jgi:hypothetical protein
VLRGRHARDLFLFGREYGPADGAAVEISDPFSFSYDNRGIWTASRVYHSGERDEADAGAFVRSLARAGRIAEAGRTPPDSTQLLREGKTHMVVEEEDGIRRVRRAWVARKNPRPSGGEGRVRGGNVKATTLILITALLTSCASAPTPLPAPPTVSPADLVAAIADEAAGRNPSVAEAGLILHTIEFHLLVGRTSTEAAGINILVLEAGGSTAVETSFLQTFVLAIPATRSPRVAAAPAVAGVAEFVRAAMDSARDLARVAREQGLPQRLTKVVLEARIERSRSSRGGVAFTVPAAVTVSAEVGATTKAVEANTITLTFVAIPER